MVWTFFDDDAERIAFWAQNRIPVWPSPTTNRIKNAFRMQLGDGLPHARPDRFILQMQDVPNEPLGFAYPVIDMDVSGEFELHGASGLNAVGREVELDIIQHLDADFPGADDPGIEYRFTFKMAGFDDFHVTFYYGWEFPGGFDKDIPYLLTEQTGGNPLTVIKDDVTMLDLDWPVPPVLGAYLWRSMSRCFVLPEEVPEPGFASFNGVDAYIGLDHNTPTHNGPHLLQADLRLRGSGKWPIMGVDTNQFLWGIDDPDGIWITVTFDDLDLPSPGTWFQYRQEFEWTSGLLLRYEIFIDDVLQVEITSTRFNTAWRNLGVAWRTVFPVWGDFDLRNMLYIKGSVASPETILNMPLDVNALDLSPDENHGTTHNMDLPSI